MSGPKRLPIPVWDKMCFIAIRVAEVENDEMVNDENHVAVLALHKVSKSPEEIFKALQKLQISNMFVYRTIKKFSEPETVRDRASKEDLAQCGLQNW